jgi:hypothetical protein
MTQIVTHDWSQFNAAVLRRAGMATPAPVTWPRNLVLAGLAIGVVGAGAYWSERRTEATPMLPDVPAVVVPPPLPPVMRIDPDDLAKLMVRIHPDDLARLSVRLNADDLARLSVRINPDDIARLNAPRPGLGALVDTPRPSNPATPSAPIVTNYTIFQNITDGDYRVTTGWVYASNTDTRPQSQFCHLYLPRIKAGEATRFVTVATGPSVRLPYTDDFVLPTGMWERAYSNCVWFNG